MPTSYRLPTSFFSFVRNKQTNKNQDEVDRKDSNVDDQILKKRTSSLLGFSASFMQKRKKVVIGCGGSAKSKYGDTNGNHPGKPGGSIEQEKARGLGQEQTNPSFWSRLLLQPKLSNPPLSPQSRHLKKQNAAGSIFREGLDAFRSPKKQENPSHSGSKGSSDELRTKRRIAPSGEQDGDWVDVPKSGMVIYQPSAGIIKPEMMCPPSIEELPKLRASLRPIVTRSSFTPALVSQVETSGKPGLRNQLKPAHLLNSNDNKVVRTAARRSWDINCPNPLANQNHVVGRTQVDKSLSQLPRQLQPDKSVVYQKSLIRLPLQKTTLITSANPQSHKFLLNDLGRRTFPPINNQEVTKSQSIQKVNWPNHQYLVMCKPVVGVENEKKLIPPQNSISLNNNLKGEAIIIRGGGNGLPTIYRTVHPIGSLSEELRVDPADISFVKKVGSGASAEVWRATWRGADVAVKILHSNIGGNSNVGISDDFYRELQIMSRLRHPNLVLLMGASVSHQPISIVTEYCAGGTLFELLYEQKFKLTLQQKLKVALDIARGCLFLHTSTPRIIHKDLKSLNILLTAKVISENEMIYAKITDFGLSRFTQGHRKEIQQGGWSGTACWMAPELFAQQPFDESIDVFAFGVILYEIFSGELPYSNIHPSLSQASISQKVLSGLRPDQSRIDLITPFNERRTVDAMKLLMSRCWSTIPKNRPSFDTIVDEIRRYK